MFLPEPTTKSLTVLLSISTLITPSITLARWLQERRRSHKLREHLVSSKELFEFIKNCPDMVTASGQSETLMSNAQAELGRTLASANVLLKRQDIKSSLPKEVSWPARLFLFYAPQSWPAASWHVFYHALTALLFAGLYSSSYAEETDLYQWNTFVQTWKNPLLATALAYFLLFMWAIWYSAAAKDRWDKTLPLPKHSRFFLTTPPYTVRELLAKVLFVWSAFELVSSIIINTYRGTFIKPQAWLGDFHSPWPVWLVNNVSPAVAVVLAYFWARVERSSSADAHIPFPRNLRFFYPAATDQENWSRLLTFWFLLAAVAMIWNHTLFVSAIILPNDPDERLGIFVGTTSVILQIFLFNIALPLYGCYRCSLTGYYTHLAMRGQAPKQLVEEESRA